MTVIPSPASPFIVVDSMPACGLSAQCATPFATEIFLDDLKTCIDISNEDINDALNTFSTLTVEQEHIRLLPAQKKKVKNIP